MTLKGFETCSVKIISIEVHMHKKLNDASWPFILGSKNNFLPHTLPLVGTSSIFFTFEFRGFALKHTNHLIFRNTTIRRLVQKCISVIILINPTQARTVIIVTPFKMTNEPCLQHAALDSAICILEGLQ